MSLFQLHKGVRNITNRKNHIQNYLQIQETNMFNNNISPITLERRKLDAGTAISLRKDGTLNETRS